MKATLFAICFLFGTTAFGQSIYGGSLNSQPVVYQFPEHIQRAAYTDMGREENLLTKSGFTYARGERPLWEVMSDSSYSVPLGDIARELKQEHAADKKSTIVWQNY